LKAAGLINDVLAQLQRDRLLEVKLLSQTGRAKEMLVANKRVSKLDDTDADAANALRFRFSGDDEAMADLLETLMKEKLPVVSLREVPLSLEDAYMSISGIGEEEAGE